MHLKASLVCFLHVQSLARCVPSGAQQFCCCLFLRALKGVYGLHSLWKFLWPLSNGAVCGCTDGQTLWLAVQSTSASPAGPLSLHLCKRFCRMPADASVPSSSEGRPSLVCALVDVGLTGCTSCPTGSHGAKCLLSNLVYGKKNRQLCKDTAFTLSILVFILVWFFINNSCVLISLQLHR